MHSTERLAATPGDSGLLSSTSEPLHLAQESHMCVTCATQKGLAIALYPKHSNALLLESSSATSQSDRTFHEDKLWGGSLPSLVMNQSCFLRLHVCISCLKTGCMSAQDNLLQ
jgi:hypothetical protein